MGKIGTAKADFAAASGNEGEQVWNRSELTGKSLGKFVYYLDRFRKREESHLATLFCVTIQQEPNKMETAKRLQNRIRND